MRICWGILCAVAVAAAWAASPKEGSPGLPGNSNCPDSAVCLGSSSCLASGGVQLVALGSCNGLNTVCCQPRSCSSAGFCVDSSFCAGTTQRGLCPGSASIQCCTARASPPAPVTTAPPLNEPVTAQDSAPRLPGNTYCPRTSICSSPSSTCSAISGTASGTRCNGADSTCCSPPKCGASGFCIRTSDCQGTTQKGLCAGDSSVKCCTSWKVKTQGVISDTGINLIKQFEGFEANFYRDSAGFLTIGYGYNCDALGCNGITAPIAQAQAEELLRRTLVPFAQCIDKAFPQLRTNQKDALVSFVYNLGCGVIRGSSVEKAVVAGDNPGVVRAMCAYVNAGGRRLPGLVRRRAAEASMFVGYQATC